MGNKRKYSVPKAFASSRPEKEKRQRRRKQETVKSEEAFSDIEEELVQTHKKANEPRKDLASRYADEDIDSDDDEEIDEDMAFDEEDEAKWGHIFDGSKKKKNANDDIDLSENESEDPDDFENDAEAIDLSAMLDDNIDNEKKGVKESDELDAFDRFESEENGEGSANDSDYSEDLDLAQIAGKVFDSEDEIENKNKKRDKKKVKFEAYDEGEFSLNHGGEGDELTLASIINSLDDSAHNALKRQVMKVQRDSESTKVHVPLHRQAQERLDREAAYKASKQEISKWMPFVQQTRRAEHLSFPLNQPKFTGTTTAALASRMKPQNEMESEISSLLKTAGLATEKQIMQSEELELKKLDPEQVKAQRIELQRMRALLFFAEQKQKRAAKIKSKKYHRLKKKEKKRLELAELEKIDPELAEAERMELERIRAEERASLRHKNGSNWNKKFDFNEKSENSKQAIIENLERHDLLMRKIKGDSSSEAEDDYSDNDNRKDENEQLESLINELESHDTTKEDKGVFGMKFMQKAMEAKKNLAIEQIRQMQNEDDGETGEDPDAGRRVENNPGRLLFGAPADSKPKIETKNSVFKMRKETEVDLDDEAFDREDEQDDQNNTKSKSNETVGKEGNVDKESGDVSEWLGFAETKIRSEKAVCMPDHGARSTNEKALKMKKRMQKDAKTAEKQANASSNNLEGNGDEVNVENVELKERKRDIDFDNQRELIEMAFADDDVVAEFAREKQEVMEGEAPQSIDVTLPGWGMWSNQLPRKQIIQEKPGISLSKRKDYRMKHVIINEKQDKKFITKYQVEKLPFPFKNKQLYEAYNRAPIGKEWNAIVSHDKMIKPRVEAKIGEVILPPKFVKQPKEKSKRKHGKKL